MPDLQFKGLPAAEAIANLQQKTDITTERWDQMLGPAHAKAFTVAGATKTDLLADLHTAVSKALENGESISQFRARFDEAVQQHGWSYNGKRGWRTRVIYDTNLRSAHMAGRWQQIEHTRKARPYLVYMTVGDSNVRPKHSKWRRIALPIDDPFWNSHYPPNGWGCRCYIITATTAQLQRMGIDVAESPKIERTERVNADTGEIYGKVPEGIDTGWDYNVGKAWIGPEQALGQKYAQLANRLPEMPDPADTPPAATQLSWQSWLQQLDAAPTKLGYAHALGQIPLSSARTLQLQNTAILTSGKTASTIPAKLRPELTDLIRQAKAILKRDNGQLVYVLGKAGPASRNVAILNPGPDGNHLQEIKKVSTASLKKGHTLITGKL